MTNETTDPDLTGEKRPMRRFAQPTTPEGIEAARFKPTGSTPIRPTPEIPGNPIVYTWEVRAEIRGQAHFPFTAVAYSGRAVKADWNHGFKTREQRDKYIAEWFASFRHRAEIKAARKAEDKAARDAGHSIAVGDLFHYSWGWEQTQCDFFEVVATTKKTVTIRAIASRSVPGSEGFMSDRRTAVPGRFLANSEPIVKRAWNDRDGSVSLSMDHGVATPCRPGQAFYCSWYA